MHKCNLNGNHEGLRRSLVAPLTSQPPLTQRRQLCVVAIGHLQIIFNRVS